MAKAISEYVVADNYMQGKAQLSGLNDKLYSDYWDSIKPQLLKIQRYPSFKEWLKKQENFYWFDHRLKFKNDKWGSMQPHFIVTFRGKW